MEISMFGVPLKNQITTTKQPILAAMLIQESIKERTRENKTDATMYLWRWIQETKTYFILLHNITIILISICYIYHRYHYFHYDFKT